MDIGNMRNLVVHLTGESVTRPIALSSRLAMHPGKSTLGRVLLPSLE
jgi:hypothetical protein